MNGHTKRAFRMHCAACGHRGTDHLPELASYIYVCCRICDCPKWVEPEGSKAYRVTYVESRSPR